jgi:hypothetical protein
MVGAEQPVLQGHREEDRPGPALYRAASGIQAEATVHAAAAQGLEQTGWNW